MKKYRVRIGFLIGFLLTSSMIVLMYLGNRLLRLSFVPYDLFDWVARVLPGPIITFGIDAMIDTMIFLGINVAEAAKTAERAIAIIQFLGVGTVIGAIYVIVLNRVSAKPSAQSGNLLGAIFGLPLIGISIAISNSPVNPLSNIAWLIILFWGWGYLFGIISKGYIERLPKAEIQGDEVRSVKRLSRRDFLITVGAASATITVVGAGLGAFLDARERKKEQAADSMAHETESSADDTFPNSNDPVMAAPGTRPEYTPIKNHYKVFLKTEPSLIPAEGYMLPITGLVDSPLLLTLDDIRNNYQSKDQFVTMSCISGRIGTSLIGTTQWTGVSMQDILADAGIQEGAVNLLISSEDGFFEIVDLELIASDERIMLCYAWDGHTLPDDHGFPLRIWIPDRYGMKQPKWITNIEVTDQADLKGYWVERNWDEVAQVKTTSVIDTVAAHALVTDGEQQLVPIGGIAYSGDRGISRVQVRVDSGPWQDATLRAPLSGTTWVIWRYDWPFVAGEHIFEVRCQEGDGTPQIEEQRQNRPSGATGIHSLERSL
ncbi:MAG: molybdopterin-dependent oxidoreductase [Chloroflexi bacterium]|nr:molybdopterin-dependent oxidoreductase [Chloroflexota bacterium]